MTAAARRAALLVVALASGVGTAAGAAEVTPKLFVHGFKGARLVDAAGGLRWLGLRQVLGFGAPIALPLVWRDGVQLDDGLRADGVLEHVRVVPWIAERQVYGPWLARARRRWGRAWHELAYDWRRDNEENLARLVAATDALARDAGRPIDVVAHSMGGLLVLAHLLAGGDRAIGRAVFVGVPFTGGIGFLPDLQNGGAVGLNRSLLSPAAQFSFPSVYTLFPDRGPAAAERVTAGGPAAASAVLVDRNGAPITIDFFAADDWVREGLGIFAHAGERSAERREFLVHALARAARFRARLTPVPGATIATAILTVTGRGHPTLARAVKDGPRATNGWDFESAPAADGDGRVLADGSLPPSPVVSAQVFSGAEHGALLNDRGVQDAIAAFLY